MRCSTVPERRPPEREVKQSAPQAEIGLVKRRALEQVGEGFIGAERSGQAEERP